MKKCRKLLIEKQIHDHMTWCLESAICNCFRRLEYNIYMLHNSVKEMINYERRPCRHHLIPLSSRPDNRIKSPGREFCTFEFFALFIYNWFVSLLAGSYMKCGVFSLTSPLWYAPINKQSQEMETAVQSGTITCYKKGGLRNNPEFVSFK